ncbi:MAG: acyltransferase family protein [Blastocatellia bacterium]
MKQGLAIEPMPAPEVSELVAPTFRLGYRPALDGLRGVAILAVLAYHLAPQTFAGGFLGVDIFFVLSGFLITTLLAQEKHRDGEIAFKPFYARRALRLLPALVVLLSVYFVVMMSRGASLKFTAAMIACVLFYASNWVMGYFGFEILGPMVHTWSLALEEQFYLCWPFLLAKLLRLKLSPQRIIHLLMAGFAASALYRAAPLLTGLPEGRAFKMFDLRADGLLIGCALGLALSFNLFKPSPSLKRWLRVIAPIAATLLVCACIAAVAGKPYMSLGGYSIIVALVALIVLAVFVTPGGALTMALQWSPLVWVGRLSYSLYLWHVPVISWLDIPTLPRPAMAGIQILASFIAASLSFYAVERPFLFLKDRLREQKPQAAPRLNQTFLCAEAEPRA